MKFVYLSIVRVLSIILTIVVLIYLVYSLYTYKKNNISNQYSQTKNALLNEVQELENTILQKRNSFYWDAFASSNTPQTKTKKEIALAKEKFKNILLAPQFNQTDSYIVDRSSLQVIYHIKKNELQESTTLPLELSELLKTNLTRDLFFHFDPTTKSIIQEEEIPDAISHEPLLATYILLHVIPFDETFTKSFTEKNISIVFKDPSLQLDPCTSTTQVAENKFTFTTTLLGTDICIQAPFEKQNNIASYIAFFVLLTVFGIIIFLIQYLLHYLYKKSMSSEPAHNTTETPTIPPRVHTNTIFSSGTPPSTKEKVTAEWFEKTIQEEISRAVQERALPTGIELHTEPIEQTPYKKEWYGNELLLRSVIEKTISLVAQHHYQKNSLSLHIIFTGNRVDITLTHGGKSISHDVMLALKHPIQYVSLRNTAHETLVFIRHMVTHLGGTFSLHSSEKNGNAYIFSFPLA
ncbi:MAG: hypothetical protein QM526_02115 [Alphaproteobacteria bacterium]|nr:hypothetical protein [Alphaproteobacteria bacterium]